MRLFEKVLLATSYLLMVALNALANILPINGANTGVISDSYPNLFAPAGFTFSIWGLIYVLLLAMILFLLTRPPLFFRRYGIETGPFTMAFVVSSLANSAWILAWHYRWIGLSVLLLLIILSALIWLLAMFKQWRMPSRQLAFIKPAIGVYAGWVTVATVANITTYLVSMGWQGFGISESIWLVIVLAVATVIGLLGIQWSNCPAYGLVFLWAYGGILSKHLSKSGFDGQYPEVLITLGLCMAVILIQTVLESKRVLKGL